MPAAVHDNRRTSDHEKENRTGSPAYLFDILVDFLERGKD
jgi:hypothetical protein